VLYIIVTEVHNITHLHMNRVCCAYTELYSYLYVVNSIKVEITMKLIVFFSVEVKLNNHSTLLTTRFCDTQRNDLSVSVKPL
jgi:hypothetical protein